jgi:type VI protein secretion system component VasK
MAGSQQTHMRASEDRDPDAAAPQQREQRSRRLPALIALVSCAAAIALLLSTGATHRPLEATAQIERTAARVEQLRTIHPEAVAEIERLYAKSLYDCERVSCDASLKARNQAAHARLEAALRRQQPGERTEAAATGPVIPPEETVPIFTGSIR